MKTAFSELLRTRRVEVGRTLKQVGNAIGTSLTYVADLEKGYRTPPTCYTRIRLLAASILLDVQELHEASILVNKKLVVAVEDPEKVKAAAIMGRMLETMTAQQLNTMLDTPRERLRESLDRNRRVVSKWPENMQRALGVNTEEEAQEPGDEFNDLEEK